MTHISKQKLKEDQLNELLLHLYSAFARLNNKTSKNFLNEFLGKEEKIMFAKRLSAIALCISGVSSYRIWTILKISPSTAERIMNRYEQGCYRNIELVLKSNTAVFKNILKTIEVIMSAGLPPRGRGRWKKTIELLKNDYK